MLRHYTIWNLMRQHTQRQVKPDSVDDMCMFLEDVIGYTVEECEKLLQYNGTKTSRISCDCVRPILNSRRNISFAAINRRMNQQKKKKNDMKKQGNIP